MEREYEGFNKEKAVEIFKNENLCIEFDLSKPVLIDQINKKTPYILCELVIEVHIPNNYREIYRINKVTFQRSEWIITTECSYCFLTEEGNYIYISKNDLQMNNANLYYYTEDFPCK